jgi:hypothetical protein
MTCRGIVAVAVDAIDRNEPAHGRTGRAGQRFDVMLVLCNPDRVREPSSRHDR